MVNCFALQLSLVVSLALGALASPSAFTHGKRQLSARELDVKKRYPEYFAPESVKLSFDSRECAAEEDIAEPSTGETGSLSKRVLDASEMKRFLMGRGAFTRDDGSVYEDGHFEREMVKRSAEVSEMTEHPNYLVVADDSGKKVLQPLLDHRRDAEAENGPDDLIAFGPFTALRWADLPMLEAELLADPSFTFVEFFGIRWDRRFLEATKEYVAAGLV